MKATVSSEARHRKLLTPIPLPPGPPLPLPSSGGGAPPSDRPPGPKIDSDSWYEGLLMPTPRLVLVR
jgi:hypothetical protein